MAVGLLLVMHGKLGRYLLETLAETLGEPAMPVDVLEVRQVQGHDVLLRQGLRMVENLDGGDGVLILTDAYGSTPSNIANKLGASLPERTAVVSGTNLPMLMRIFNYAQEPLEKLALLAVEGGQRGITLCPKS